MAENIFPKADDEHRKDGWTFDIIYLKRIKEIVEMLSGHDIYLEDIEDVLVAIEREGLNKY